MRRCSGERAALSLNYFYIDYARLPFTEDGLRPSSPIGGPSVSATVSNDSHVTMLDMPKKDVASEHEFNPCPFWQAD